ncbi:MAG: flagellar filament capping protein FliD [Treponema sp.]|jgi:flagellar hook-associated protein 2|nr:flagellar filament capping protein FliD [Treponema sp.]
MSDAYIPGISSRFNTDQIIENLMKIERIPRERSEKEKENFQNQKTYWQDLNRRIVSFRESARQLYSFQNPFSERIVTSSDDSIITGTAIRQAIVGAREFTVKQIAQSDRFLSSPIDDSFKVEAGTYTFTVGKEKVSFDYKGGTIQDFTENLTKRGKDKVEARLMVVKQGSKSLLIEAKSTGAENKLDFTDKATDLVLNIGMMEKAERVNDITLTSDLVTDKLVNIDKNSLVVGAHGTVNVKLPELASDGLILRFETSTEVRATEPPPSQEPPPGPTIPGAGLVSYKDIAVENDPLAVPIPEWTPPPIPIRVDDMNVLFITFTDGDSVQLDPIEDGNLHKVEYSIAETDKIIASLDIKNQNTHRDVFISNIQVVETNNEILVPKNPVSTAQDAIISLEGIDTMRPGNTIDDLLPGVTVTAKEATEKPVRVAVEVDRKTVKDSLITFVGNYNRLMSEINVLTRNDIRVIQELTYLSSEEQAELQKKLGTFIGDSTITQFRSVLQNAVTTSYPTADGTTTLAKFGISTDARVSSSSGGYDPSKFRGYLEIDERKLDDAVDNNITALQQIFGFDSNGDRLVDTGAAYACESLARPYVETGGLISIKIATLDSRIKDDDRRIIALDKQLADKEASLKSQYSQMEGAYNRMEQMSNSLDNFSRQNSRD